MTYKLYSHAHELLFIIMHVSQTKNKILTLGQTAQKIVIFDHLFTSNHHALVHGLGNHGKWKTVSLHCTCTTIM